MITVPTKNNDDPNTLAQAPEYNAIASELENAVLNSNQALDESGVDVSQLSKAISNYVSQSDYYLTTGSSANTYVAIAIAPIPGISNSGSSYFDGMRFRVNIAADNTGASTLNINGFGAINIVKGVSNTALTGGELVTGRVAEFLYVGGANVFLLIHNGIINYVPSSAGGLMFLVDLSAPQAATNNVQTRVNFDNVTQNLGTFYDTGTFESTIPVTGLYNLSFGVAGTYTNTANPTTELDGARVITTLFINGTPFFKGNGVLGQNTDISPAQLFDTPTSKFVGSIVLEEGDIVHVEVLFEAAITGGTFSLVINPVFTFFNLSLAVPLSL